MKDAIDMANSPVRLRIKVKREARNETPSCGHVWCIYVCRSFLEGFVALALDW